MIVNILVHTTLPPREATTFTGRIFAAGMEHTDRSRLRPYAQYEVNMSTFLGEGSAGREPGTVIVPLQLQTNVPRKDTEDFVREAIQTGLQWLAHVAEKNPEYNQDPAASFAIYRSLGQIAYEAYCASTGGKSLISGDQLPGWDGLKPEIRTAWEAAGEAVRPTAVFQKILRTIEDHAKSENTPEAVRNVLSITALYIRTTLKEAGIAP
jgi:hypothetical protein